MGGSNWQQLSGGSTNPWTIRRDDGTPTANYGDHIICDGGTVTLPSPQANEAVLVSNISSITEIVPNGTETIDGESSVLFDQTDPIAFVSNGVNWYVSNNLDYIGVIPDSVVSRPADNTSASQSSERGLAIEVASNKWTEIGARIGSKSSGFTRGYVRESDGTVVTSVDISGKSAGDTVTFRDVNLSANTTYYIDMDAEGSSYTIGAYGSPSYPYESDDGEISITAGSFDGTSESSGTAWGYEEVGNVGF